MVLFRSIFALSFLIWIFGFTSSAQCSVLQQTFEDSAAGFSITMPSGWVMEPSALMPGPIRATLKFKVPVDQFTPNVTVRVGLLLKERMTLESLVAAERKVLSKKLKFLEEVNISAMSDYWPTGHQWKWEDPKLELVFLQRFFVLAGKSYVLTAAAKKKSWPRFQKDFEQIFNSFQLQDRQDRVEGKVME